MNYTFSDIIRLGIPLNSSDKGKLESVRDYFTDKNFKTLKKLVKIKKAKIVYKSFDTTSGFLPQTTYPHIEGDSEFAKHANKDILEQVHMETYKSFALNSHKKIVDLIAPNIIGMDGIKLACALQLFADERTHVLLLGDPGTGKTDIVSSVSELSKISSFGLGSGTSNAGLGVTFKGNEMIKGLLPLADGGICCIDELNLMKNDERAYLYNAMEKGFITYDKAGKHTKVDANVKVLATANPKGDKFAGWMKSTLLKQMPFEQALLSRFHIIFLVRKPDTKQFMDIAKKIVQNEKKKLDHNKDFVKDYIEHAKNISVKVPKKAEDELIGFVEELKKDEAKYLVEIGPRLVVGLVRFAKASARINLREEVSSVDVERIKKLFLDSLKI